MTSIKHAHNSKNAPNPPLGAIENKKGKPSAIYTQAYVDGLLGQIANQKVLLEENSNEIRGICLRNEDLESEIYRLKKAKQTLDTQQPGPQIGLGLTGPSVDDILT